MASLGVQTRSAGITAAAVVAIFGSVLTILMGVLVGVSLGFLSLSSVRTPFLKAFVMIECAVLFGLGVWGILTAVGILRLKPWARIAMLVFAGLLALVALAGVVVALLMPFPAPTEEARAAMTIGKAVAAFFNLVLLGVAVWWLVYFTRRSVVAQFEPSGVLTPAASGPLSIKIIGWFMVVSGLLCLLYVPYPFPTLFFGQVFEGSSARTLYLAFAVVTSGLGLGLLKRYALAHPLATAYFFVLLLNALFMLVLPNLGEKMAELTRFMNQGMGEPPSTPPQMPWRFLFGMGIPFWCIPLWFLITRRGAYLNAARGSSPS